MIHFERISIGHRNYLMRELTFNSAIRIAKTASDKIEQRLTVFLQDILADTELPLKMTVQERYFLLLNYLNVQQGTILDVQQDVSSYLITDSKAWQTEYTRAAITVRQLTGYDAELLEKHCTNIADWMAASMAIQLFDADSEMPPLAHNDMSEEERQQRFFERLEFFKDLTVSGFERYYALLQVGNAQMESLVRLSYDSQGIVLRGADDAPCRFCPSSTFYGIIGQLDGYFNQQGAPTSN